mmetsp:Transcript_11967/g.10569  ORF Transcript_11967/g.10569 Transcript_11967/m.10569 type:complete len:182 (+) Transcript_11967:327-872(+)
MYNLCKGIFHKISIFNQNFNRARNELEVQLVEDTRSSNARTISAQSFKSFFISQSLREEFESDACKQDWGKLIESIQINELSPKDLIVLNLYFTFMGLDLSIESLEEDLLYILEENKDKWSTEFDPDTRFTFNENNVEKIKELLIGLNHEKFVSSEVSQLCIFDVFTNIIIEALQFLEFIP